MDGDCLEAGIERNTGDVAGASTSPVSAVAEELGSGAVG